MIRPTSEAPQTRSLRPTWVVMAALTVATLAPMAHGDNGPYTVQRGDTPASVARHLQVTMDLLLAANHLAPDAVLTVGQQLQLPVSANPANPSGPTAASTAGAAQSQPAPSATYLVQAGDSLPRIAQRLATTVPALAAANHIAADSILQIGQKLTVPGAAQAAPTTVATATVAPATATPAARPAPAPATMATPSAAKAASVTAALAPQPVPAVKPVAVTPAKPTEPPKPVGLRVGDDRVKLRTSPSVEAGVVKTVEPGSRLTIVGHEGQWWKVQVPGSSQTAYVAGWVVDPILPEAPTCDVATSLPPTTSGATSGATSVAAVTTAAMASKTTTMMPPLPLPGPDVKPAPPNASSATIAEERVNLRSEPTTESERLTVLTRGTALTVLQNAGDWIKVKAGEAVGWVSKSLTSLGQALQSGKGAKLVATAMTYLGTPYRRGGASHDGVDCSGLVYAVSKENGIDLPRTSSDMWGKGNAVDKGNLRPGDLVFFQNTYREGISHVGIYVGGGQFVHAVRSGKPVQVSDLGESYYSAHWAGAYRVVD